MARDSGRTGSIECGEFNRRTIMKGLAGSLAAIALPATLRAQVQQPFVRVTSQEIAMVPREFMGLSYESSQLSHPQFFCAANHDLIQFFRTLGDQGVLRIGGNMSQYTYWAPTESLKGVPGETEGPDPGRGSNLTFPVAPLSIDNLNGFLQATGWKLIYGLNLARGQVESLVEEAKYVARVAGDRLVAFQFGNEPDLFKHVGDQNNDWTYEEFIAKWKELYAAIRVELPHAPIAGPDSSSQPWNAQFVKEVGNEITLLTGHYYAEGPPTDPRMTVEYLLRPGERLQTRVMPSIELSRESGIPYRMAEGNTCTRAGKAGVSDTFASALWAADFMLTIAQAGASGVNLHGGADGLYTPIAGSPSKGFTARPIYYGMLFAKQLLTGRVLQTSVETAGENVAAHATRDDTTLRLTIINREPHPVTCRLAVAGLPTHIAGSVWRLEAPSIASTTDVTLAKAGVTARGVFRAGSDEAIHFAKGEASIYVPPYSASLVRVSTESKSV